MRMIKHNDERIITKEELKNLNRRRKSTGRQKNGYYATLVLISLNLQLSRSTQKAFMMCPQFYSNSI